MSRWIEYEPLMAELEREVELADDWKTAHEIANVVKYAPSIDICFCRECKYAEVSVSPITGLWCTRFGINDMAMEADDFCSYGEREGE